MCVCVCGGVCVCAVIKYSIHHDSVWWWDIHLIYSVCSVLFCSVLFCSVLFCSVLFCSTQFCSVLFCSFLFCSVLFYSVQFSSGQFNPIISSSADHLLFSDSRKNRVSDTAGRFTRPDAL